MPGECPAPLQLCFAILPKQLIRYSHFCCRYGVEDTDIVTHPNDYFDKAMALAEEKAANAGNKQQQSQSQSQSSQSQSQPLSQGGSGASPVSQGLKAFANGA
eukprot:SAG31_NODE_1382_length_8579_cov_25.152830_5_plen_102_part_00